MKIPVDKANLMAIGNALAMLAANASTCMITSNCFNRLDGLSSTDNEGSCFLGKLDAPYFSPVDNTCISMQYKSSHRFFVLVQTAI